MKVDKQSNDNMGSKMKLTKDVDTGKTGDTQVAALSDKMNLKQINAFIKAFKSGSPVKNLVPPGLTKPEITQLENLAKKR
jgi:hypothetical protein